MIFLGGLKLAVPNPKDCFFFVIGFKMEKKSTGKSMPKQWLVEKILRIWKWPGVCAMVSSPLV